ncbi:MAG: hypothetical protein U0R80_15320 [Nocardioidaceae bacterium]
MRRLTTERVATTLLLSLVFALASRLPTDTDVWWHLRAGEQIVHHGFIRTDSFSFTMAGKTWVDHSWGAEALLFGLWQLAGRWGLALFTATLATLGMWLVHRASSGSLLVRGPALLLGAAAAAIFWTPRPQMLTFALTALLLWLLHVHKREGRDLLWWVPPMMAVWANLHAGFAIGFVLLLGSLAGEVLGHLLDRKGTDVVPWPGVRRLALVTAVSVGTVCLNPYGWRILAVPFQTLGIGALRDYVFEWQPPDLHEPSTWPFALLVLALLVVLALGRRRLDWTDLVLAGGTAYLAFTATRNIAVFAVVATAIVARHLAGLAEDRGWPEVSREPVAGRRAIVHAALVGVVVLGAGAKLVAELERPDAGAALRRTLPVGAADFLERTDPPGRMFNSYNWGGYLMWRLPDRAVFVDGRTDLYGDDFVVHDFLDTAEARPGWQQTLDRWDIDLVVIERDGSLARALGDDPSWRLAFSDDRAAVFERVAIGG